ncbi:uncharacterized protein LOC131957123 [Physella acuta]|uniref:uncharacterized protein LOC131957123 n=1 Tax=Physella acuta TaxID=109671 RepID=UPI0027DE7858|nr:uncharacterized protein LOC131957123 [Physella acuta]
MKAIRPLYLVMLYFFSVCKGEDEICMKNERCTITRVIPSFQSGMYQGKINEEPIYQIDTCGNIPEVTIFDSHINLIKVTTQTINRKHLRVVVVVKLYENKLEGEWKILFGHEILVKFSVKFKGDAKLRRPMMACNEFNKKLNFLLHGQRVIEAKINRTLDVLENVEYLIKKQVNNKETEGPRKAAVSNSDQMAFRNGSLEEDLNAIA